MSRGDDQAKPCSKQTLISVFFKRADGSSVAPPVVKKRNRSSKKRPMKVKQEACAKSEPVNQIEGEPKVKVEANVQVKVEKPSYENPSVSKKAKNVPVKFELPQAKSEKPPKPVRKNKCVASKTLTDEQSAIIRSGLGPRKGARPAQVVRVTAAAGSGKTTTLEELASSLVTLGHRKVLYLAFNKAAATDLQNKFTKAKIKAVHCKTMNSVALKYGVRPRNRVWQSLGSSLNSDSQSYVLEAKISGLFKERIVKQFSLDNVRKPKKNAHFLVTLAVTWIAKSLTKWLQSDASVEAITRTDIWDFTYYPAVLKNMEKFECAAGQFYVDCVADIWKLAVEGNFPISHDIYTKYAQLYGLKPRFGSTFSAILIDEAQDLNSCLQSLFIDAQRPTHDIYIVGDAVQCIYSFRGSKSSIMGNIRNVDQDFLLTCSFRFGDNIARIANKLLFMKTNSLQGPHFKSYFITPSVLNGPGIILPRDHSPPLPYTVLSRANSSLVFWVLSNLPKIADLHVGFANTSIKNSMTSLCSKVKDIALLYTGCRPKSYEFAKYASYSAFKDAVEDLELLTYAPHIMIVETYKEQTAEKIRVFEERMKKRTSKKTMDVMLTNTHQAKGLEWDHVELCDDFCTLDTFSTVDNDAMFGFAAGGDNLNLWYVAVTRAKKALSLPEKWYQLVDTITSVLNGEQLGEEHQHLDLEKLIVLLQKMHSQVPNDLSNE